MKQVLLKTIVIVVGKLTRSRVLRGRAVFCGALRGRDKARKFSPSCEAGRGWGKKKSCKAGRRLHTSDLPHSIITPNPSRTSLPKEI